MKRNPSHPDRGDERLPHTARSGSQQRMLARGVEVTNAGIPSAASEVQAKSLLLLYFAV